MLGALAMSDRWLFTGAVVVYGICSGYSLLLWRRGFRADNLWLYLLLGGGALFHTAAMFLRGFRVDSGVADPPEPGPLQQSTGTGMGAACMVVDRSVARRE